jgi:hypothetical protein
MRWWRWPPAHFVGIGIMLFAIERYAASPAPRPAVVITAARLAQLAADVRRESKATSDEQALVERAIEEEILYREALRHGLDRGEQSIRWRLTQKMRFLLGRHGEEALGEDATAGSDEDLYRRAVALQLERGDPIVRGILVQKMRFLLKRSAGERPPDDAQLRAYLERHRDRYLQPARASFWHVFLAGEQRGAAVEREACRLLDRLSAQAIPPAQAVRLGDPFPLGTYQRAQSAQDVTRLFGPEFARAVLALEPGSWAGPVRSSYGLHLVWVEETQPAHMPRLEAVRPRVLAGYIEERRNERLVAEMHALRAKYTVRVEPYAGGQG